MDLIVELKRRSVFKVGAAYLVVGWLAVQAASIGFPAFDAPPWVLRVFILAVLLGFPLALVLAWFFDVTPEGVRATGSRPAGASVFLAAGALAALALGWYFVGAPSFRAGAADTRAVAVLPFVNMSGDAGYEYFSDGVSEEILNVLAQTPELKVAARTSSFAFKGKSMEVPEIARTLKVRMVLEGSVRRQGDRVRITAQLIDASSGYHVWSDTYDRQLKDVLDIQDDIAHAIARQLEVKLGGGRGRRAAVSTRDPAAYDLYLKGLALWQRREEKNLQAAEADFHAAIARDPGFAKAWAGLALTRLVLPDWSLTPPTVAYPEARDAAEHALALDPGLPEAYAVLGYVAYSDGRAGTGRVLLDHALKLAPSYATAYQWLGESLAYQGDLEGGLRMAERAVELDPVSDVARVINSYCLAALGRNEEALKVSRSLLADHPDSNRQLQRVFALSILVKRYPDARQALLRTVASRGPESKAFANALVDALEGKADVSEVADRLASLPRTTEADPGLMRLDPGPRIVWFNAVGRKDLAVAEYERLAQANPYLARGYSYSMQMDPIRCEPRFRQILHDLNVSDPRAAAVCGR